MCDARARGARDAHAPRGERVARVGREERVVHGGRAVLADVPPMGHYRRSPRTSPADYKINEVSTINKIVVAIYT